MRKTKLHTLNKFLLLMATCFLWHFASSQNPTITVTGTVLDPASNEPIVGAVVAVKGTTVATTTDIDGKYTIQAAPDAILVVSYAGFTEQEIPVKNSSTVDVSMVEDSESLHEVVAIGYGTQEKEDVTGAISTVKSRELNQVVVTDAAQSLQGRVSGVSITQNTGAPGSPVTVQIRGVGTIGSSGPFYVVNGVPVDDISFLNTNDIESMDVLKDASSAAVYGSRAANGVVLVTTKRGSSKNSGIDVRFLTGISQPWKELKLMDAHQYAIEANTAQFAANGTTLYNPDTIGKGTDWQKQIFRKAIMQQYYVGTHGGNDKSNYYVSGSYLSQQGIVKTSYQNKFNFNAAGDYKLSERLKVGTFISTMYSNQNIVYDAEPFNSVIANALAMDPITTPYSGKGGDTIYGSPSAGSTTGARTDATNPLAHLNTRSNKNNRLNFTGNWFGEYQIIKGLNFKTNLGLIYNDNINSGYNGVYVVDVHDFNPQSMVQKTSSVSTRIMWENSLNYERVFASKHKVGGLLLTGLYNNYTTSFFASKQGTPSDDPSQQYLSSSTNASSAVATGSSTSNAIVSYLARLSYEYDERYLITVNARRDGSSRFPTNNRWGNFPSAAVGWKISNEKFFAPIKGYVSFLKLRASWGQLGNQNLNVSNTTTGGADYPYTTNISQNLNYPIGGVGVNGAASQSVGNQSIKWETVTTSNVAADFGFLKDKILLSVDAFTKGTKNMLTQTTIPAVTGLASPPYVNYGSMMNKGLEASLTYRNQDHAFKYSISGNITGIHNEITQLAAPIYDGYFRGATTNITQQGSSVAEFYGYQVTGVVQTQAQAATLQKEEPGVHPGDFIYKDVNGDGVIDSKDRTGLGSPLPKFYYGISGNAEFKGFDISFTFQGTQGNKIYNGTKYELESGILYSNLSENMVNAWSGPGTSNTLPGVTLSTTSAIGNRVPSSFYVENGSYLRLKNFQFGYNIPPALLQKAKIQKLRIYVGGQNLLTFTKYSGLDPEIGVSNYGTNGAPASPLNIGVDQGGTYPQARTYQVGINATF